MIPAQNLTTKKLTTNGPGQTEAVLGSNHADKVNLGGAPSEPPQPTSLGLLDGQPQIVAEGLELSFGDKVVVEGIDVQIPKGAITALIGPTGSGKTTFLRTINRMNDHVAGFRCRGRLLFGGRDVRDPSVDVMELRRRVGMLFQRPNPFPMSIFDNVVAGVRVHHMVPRRRLRDVARFTLEQVGLWEVVGGRLSDSPFRLSGGQQQLLCLARALAVRPEVLLLDEPTSSLDPVTTGRIEDLMRSLTPELTLVVVTHNLQQARRVADYVMFFYGGRLMEAGPAAQVFEAPKCPETVSYISGRIG